jgi:hypothetical protein
MALSVAFGRQPSGVVAYTVPSRLKTANYESDFQNKLE